MMPSIGIFRMTIAVAHLARPDTRRALDNVMVDAAAVVFAEQGDMVLLGAHGLDGLNLRVDLLRKELVPAGPVPAAALHVAA